MAPHRGSSKPARGGRSNGGGTRKPSGISKSRVAKKATSKLPPPKQQKTKAASSTIKHGVGKKKKRVYTEKELGIPKLNMITPLGVEAPKGKKRGKVFVDDAVGPRDFPHLSHEYPIIARIPQQHCMPFLLG